MRSLLGATSAIWAVAQRANNSITKNKPVLIPPLYFAAEEKLRRGRIGGGQNKTALLGRLQDGAAEQGIYVD
jgi:hypothetical protein